MGLRAVALQRAGGRGEECQLEPEELELIFKPFYRGRTCNGEGTGLGLAIVRKIVGLHNGEVGARNVPEGFQVWIRLPAATQA